MIGDLSVVCTGLWKGKIQFASLGSMHVFSKIDQCSPGAQFIGIGTPDESIRCEFVS